MKQVVIIYIASQQIGSHRNVMTYFVIVPADKLQTELEAIDDNGYEIVGQIAGTNLIEL